MSTLLIDEGNSSAKFALLSESKQDMQIESVEFSRLKPGAIEKILIASVKADDDSILPDLSRQFPQIKIIRIHTTPAAFGLCNAYSDYQRLGVDRWLAMLGAKSISRRAFIVIDAGTAITIDAVDKSGQHLGGWILPNVAFSAERLAARSGKIKLIHEHEPGLGLGKITEDCIFNGLYASHIELIKSLAASLSKTHGLVDIFLTGGDSQIYQKLLTTQKINGKIDNQLIFKGMSLFANTTRIEPDL